MTDMEIIEDIDSVDYKQVTSNLISWLQEDIDQRRAEMEFIKESTAFFNELLEMAVKLDGIETPGAIHEKQARALLSMINERRLIDKTPDWDALSREEQIERVHQSDAVSVERYFPTPVKNNEGKQ